MERCPFGVRIREVSIWRGSTVPSLKVITSAEREVKDSRRSEMYQSCNFLTRLGKQSL